MSISKMVMVATIKMGMQCPYMGIHLTMLELEQHKCRVENIVRYGTIANLNVYKHWHLTMCLVRLRTDV